MGQRQKERLLELVDKLDHDQQCRTIVYLEKFIEVDELSKLKEEQLLEITGGKKHSTIDEHSWNAMLRRAELAEERDRKKQGNNNK